MSFCMYVSRNDELKLKSNLHNVRDGIACLVHPGVRDKRRVSEVGLSQPGHEAAFWWRHN